MDHYHEDDVVSVWSLDRLLNPNFVGSGRLCFLNIGESIDCKGIVAYKYEIYVFEKEKSVFEKLNSSIFLFSSRQTFFYLQKFGNKRQSQEKKVFCFSLLRDIDTNTQVVK